MKNETTELTQEVLNKTKDFYMDNLSNTIAELFMIYKEFLNMNDYNYYQLVNDAREEINLNEYELIDIINNSKQILIEKYSIKIINENPIEYKQI